MVYIDHPSFIKKAGVPMKKFLEFLKSKQIRGNLITAGIGLAIVVVGTWSIESKSVSFFVSLAGTVLVITSFHEIMNKVPKD